MVFPLILVVPIYIYFYMYHLSKRHMMSVHLWDSQDSRFMVVLVWHVSPRVYPVFFSTSNKRKKLYHDITNRHLSLSFFLLLFLFKSLTQKKRQQYSGLTRRVLVRVSQSLTDLFRPSCVSADPSHRRVVFLLLGIKTMKEHTDDYTCHFTFGRGH